MSRSEVDLREVQDMLPDTVRRHGGRISLPATAGSSRAARRHVLADSRGPGAEGAKRAGLRWPSCWAATSSSSTHYRGEEIYVARCRRRAGR